MPEINRKVRLKTRLKSVFKTKITISWEMENQKFQQLMSKLTTLSTDFG